MPVTLTDDDFTLLIFALSFVAMDTEGADRHRATLREYLRGKQRLLEQED